MPGCKGTEAELQKVKLCSTPSPTKTGANVLERFGQKARWSAPLLAGVMVPKDHRAGRFAGPAAQRLFPPFNTARGALRVQLPGQGRPLQTRQPPSTS